jgi:CRISPR-associated endonuclease/helicase Cas3
MDRVEDYKQFFQRLTGFEPNPYQMRVWNALLDGQSVVLRAPTGSGKTWAVVVPFLYALHANDPIADRLLYALPLRSLATSLYDSTEKAAKNCEYTKTFAERIRIQTGELREDPLFEGRVTFTTIDQLLSSYLIQPVGLTTRKGNINAGALLGSLVCFDEFHLLEPARSMATAIEMLQTLTVTNPLSRFVLMTATLSDKTLHWLTDKLKAKFIDVPPEEVEKLPNEIGKTRYYQWQNDTLHAAAIAKVHDGKRSIVIANTVARAQQLYEDLRSAMLGKSTLVRLLHSRFLPDDRKRHERDLACWFGPKASVTDVILVSTQVVEAGLDFSSDNLHTEVAPMSSIVQRAGRCARRRNETGTVWCYPLESNAEGKPAYGAYKDVATLVDATAAALQEEAATERQYQFHDELRLVNQVHTDWELAQLAPFANLSSRRTAIRKAMDGDDPAAVRNLVRDSSSLNVVITDNPEAIDFNRRQWPEMLSVPPMSLFRLFRDAVVSPGGWIVKTAREKDVAQDGTITVTWPTISSSHELLSAGWLVAIHPDYATYDRDVGLILGREGPAAAIRYRERPKHERYSYKYETYAEHIRRVVAAGHARDEDNRIAARRLAASLNTTEGQLAVWLDTIYRLHDVGKLSQGWQDAVWNWQVQKPRPVPTPRPPLAHTDFDPATDGHLKKYNRPPHAAEGAYAAVSVLKQRFAEQSHAFLLLAAVTAIVRHHGAFTSELSDFRLITDAAVHIAQTLSSDSSQIELLNAPDEVMQGRFRKYLLTATNERHASALPLYFYLVRRLRIADQNSFRED